MWERMSALYLMYDKYEKCQNALNNALEIKKKVFADDAPEMIIVKELLAACYLKQGKNRAVPVYVLIS